MRILLINPNTTASITDLAYREAVKVAAAGTVFVPVTGRLGARYIASRAAYAIAGHAVLDAYAEAGHGFDGILLACFGDPALDALRELSGLPVVGMADAAMAQAAATGPFAVVTGGVLWGPMLTEFAASRGFGSALICVETVAPSGADIARDPDGSLALLASACEACVRRGAQTVILGGAGLAGLKSRLQPLVRANLIDGLEAGISAIEAAVREAQPAARGTPPVETVGLGQGLQHRMA
jgi:allantoin racemase